MWTDILGLWNYWMVVVLMMIGLYTLISRQNLVKKMMGLGVFQVSVIMLYVSMGKVKGGTAPIEIEGAGPDVYSNPVPHVLMLTAIVVGIATTALGLSLVVRIREAYGTVEEDELVEIDAEAARREAQRPPGSPSIEISALQSAEDA